jgi:hypothetical protein
MVLLLQALEYFSSISFSASMTVNPVDLLLMVISRFYSLENKNARKSYKGELG